MRATESINIFAREKKKEFVFTGQMSAHDDGSEHEKSSLLGDVHS